MNRQMAKNYCRLHYVKHWKDIQTEKKKKQAKSIDNYVKHILRNNPEFQPAQKKGEVFEEALDLHSPSHFFQDDFDHILNDLGNRADLDRLLDAIKVDKNF